MTDPGGGGVFTPNRTLVRSPPENVEDDRTKKRHKGDKHTQKRETTTQQEEGRRKQKRAQGTENSESENHRTEESLIGIKSGTETEGSGKTGQKLKTPQETNLERKRGRQEDNDTSESEDEDDVIDIEDSKRETDTLSVQLEEILGALKDIRVAVSREQNSKISFNKQDQATVREAVELIGSNLTRWAYSIGKKETDNVILKNKIEKQNKAIRELKRATRKSPPKKHMTQLQDAGRTQYTPSVGTRVEFTEGEEERGEQKKSYSKIVRDGVKGIEKQGKSYQTVPARRREPKDPEPWKTPEMKRRHQAIVRLKGKEGNVDETWNKIKDNISVRDIGGGFKYVSKLASGAVILECQDGQQKEAVERRLKEVEELEVSGNKERLPTLKLVSAEGDYTKEEFMMDFLVQNPDIEQKVRGKILSEHINIVYKKPRANPRRFDWTLQLEPELFKYVVKLGKVNFNLERIRVEEVQEMVMCMRCCAYGHVVKYCKETADRCYRCAKEHRAKDCTTQTLECINCQRLGYKIRAHRADDKNCPAYRRKLELRREQTVYGR